MILFVRQKGIPARFLSKNVFFQLLIVIVTAIAVSIMIFIITNAVFYYIICQIFNNLHGIIHPVL